ncbi:FtsX-like permease family protein [Ruania zhangjianzhongii]|uniref:FtsX-like permease family protein n=1 Tax=Ruania zhangjianzhongii TaxID=2603206 RepID=UPI0011C779B9|nr:FtsX-like permease family protein [Ruania zhangjianzhongii]
MTAVLALGLRLAKAGGRLRALSIVAGNAFGVVLLLVALSLPAALYPDPAERAELQVQIFGILLFLLVPAVILLVTVGRLSSAVRDRRLAALRLLGLSPWRTRLVAAVENGVLALVGALLGAGVMALVLAWLGPALVDTGWMDQAPRTSVVAGVTVVLVVTVVSVLVGTASTWERELPGRGRAEATRHTPGIWRLGVLLVGLGLLGGLWMLEPHTRLQVWLFAPFLLGGGVLTAVGIALTIPLLTSWCARGLVRSARVAPRLAGRAIQNDPVGPSRVVAGLGVVTFLTVAALAFLGAFENMPNYRYALQVVGEGPQEMGVYAEDDGPLVGLDELAEIPGVQAVIPDHAVTIPCADLDSMPEPLDGEQCGGLVFVGTCGQLAQIMTMSGCDDSRSARIDPVSGAVYSPSWSMDTFHGDAVDLTILSGEDLTRRTIDLTGDPITMDAWATVGEWAWPASAEVFVPVALVDDILGPVTRVRVNADGGLAVQERVAEWASARGYTSFANPMMDFEAVQTTRIAVWSLSGVALGTGLLLFALTAADRARERRRHVARQIMVGVPVRVLRASQSLQLVIPVLTTSALAILAGLVLAGGYARQAQYVPPSQGGLMGAIEETFAVISLQSWLVLAGMIALAVLLAVASTVPLIRTRLRPELLRRE